MTAVLVLREAFRGVVLSDDQRDRLDREERELNQWRLRWILPLMILMNAAHVFFLMRGTLTEGSIPVGLEDWTRGLLAVHAVTGLVALVPLALAYLLREPGRWLGPLAALVYQLHAAAVAGVDQLNHGTVAPYVAYALVNVVVVAMRPLEAVVVFAAGTAGFLWALEVMQPDSVARAATLPTGPSVLVPAVCISWFLHNSRRKNLFFRDTIAAQGQALEELNQNLQARVDEQVASLVQRSREVEALNEQLQEKVRDRSRELSAALDRLAQHEPVAPPITIGSVLAGRYELGTPIGQGGMGIVHRGVDSRTGEPVAIKVIRGGGMSPMALVRFLREVETAASVRHPAIVRMLHVDVTEDGLPFQVQELVEGQTLATWLDRLGVLDPAVVLHVLAGLCDALAAAHAQGVVHRDVKPANLVLVPSGPGLKLLDFGIAKLSRPVSERLTVTGAMVGTPAYMGPELWEGTGEATPASDVFAVGVTVVRALTGVLPRAYLGQSERLELGVPDEVRAAVERCLDSRPEARPGAGELADLASRWADGDGLAARVASGRLLGASDPGGSGDTHLSFG
ncbi:MAG: serine/threonine protein kinase [Alphaproteobacteria bacterium]|nr:serine/threonine protein kinase [Alphaproteobacteria bacterium]MCB9694290.1 serine/threonine protein kinase [Alphaproteobacteria bacterium]